MAAYEEGTGATWLSTQELYSPQCPPRAVALVSEQSRARDGGRRTFSPLPSCLATRPLGAALSYTYKESQGVQADLVPLSRAFPFIPRGGGGG